MPKIIDQVFIIDRRKIYINNYVQSILIKILKMNFRISTKSLEKNPNLAQFLNYIKKYEGNNISDHGTHLSNVV